MKVDIVTFKELFQKDVQYQVPIFQREYVWTLENQWEALWEDIQDTAEEYLKKLKKLDNDRAEAQQRTRRHFMGAVVLQQKQGTIADTQKCDIIDGQQRITTAQLILNAARDVIGGTLGDRRAKNLEQLLGNRFGEDTDRFKLWPALSDRDAFRYAMTKGDEGSDSTPSGICAAHGYFHDRIEEWFNSVFDVDDTVTVEEKAHALETTLLGLFEFVTIDLAVNDDSNIIFEVLNARGTPLSPADLIKNYMLYTAEKEGRQGGAEELHDKVWGHFLDPWWSLEVRQGALIRTQLDIFLNYWLASALTKEIRSNRVYPEFVEYVREQSQSSAEYSIQTVAGEINRYSKIYHGWYEYAQDGHPAFGGFFRRSWRCGLGGMSPLVLWLFAQRNHGLPEEELVRIVGHIESFLVRRAMCRINTAGLNRLGVTLLGRVREVGDKQILHTLTSTLTDMQGALRWPTDDEVEQAVLKQPMYGRVGVAKIRMILAALEEQERRKDPYSQSVAEDLEKRTVEHIMPRAWHDNWPPPDDTNHENGLARRNLLVDTLGNLTLLTGKLNASISNGPWHVKHSVNTQACT